MNWLTSYVRPKIRNIVSKKDIPDNLWIKCPSCSHMVFHKEIEQNSSICPHCNHHFRIGATKRIEMLMDSGYENVEFTPPKDDPLKFEELKKYSDKLKDYRKKTGMHDAAVTVSGTIDGSAAVCVVLDFSFMGGSMGTFVGESIVQAAKKAIANNCGLVIVTAAGGARMQEGILSLMQMARTTAATDELREKGLPFIVILTDPTTGGVTASFAMLGDIAIAEPKALIGFAGPRVIQETIREQLPQGFQRSEYLIEHGMIDMIVDRRQLKSTLGNILSMLNPKTGATQTSKAKEI